MKKLIVIAVMSLMTATLVQAEEVVLKQKYDRYFVYSVKDVAEITNTNDGCVLNISGNHGETGNFTAVQWAAPYSAGVTAGKKYRAMLTVKASAPTKIAVQIMDQDKPWATYASKGVDLEADTPADITLDWTPDKDVKGGLRAPGMFLGLAKQGTLITISNVKFVEIKD